MKNFGSSCKWYQILGIFEVFGSDVKYLEFLEILGNNVKFLEFLQFLEMTSNSSKTLIFLESGFKNFPLFRNKGFFIYIFCRLFWENSWKWLQLSRRYLYFWSLVSKFLFVCKQDLFIYIFCRLFRKNSWKWRKILGIFRKIRIFMKFYVLTCEYLYLFHIYLF